GAAQSPAGSGVHRGPQIVELSGQNIGALLGGERGRAICESGAIRRTRSAHSGFDEGLRLDREITAHLVVEIDVRLLPGLAVEGRLVGHRVETIEHLFIDAAAREEAYLEPGFRREFTLDGEVELIDVTGLHSGIELRVAAAGAIAVHPGEVWLRQSLRATLKGRGQAVDPDAERVSRAHAARAQALSARAAAGAGDRLSDADALQGNLHLVNAVDAVVSPAVAHPNDGPAGG